MKKKIGNVLRSSTWWRCCFDRPNIETSELKKWTLHFHDCELDSEIKLRRKTNFSVFKKLLFYQYTFRNLTCLRCIIWCAILSLFHFGLQKKDKNESQNNYFDHINNLY